MRGIFGDSNWEKTEVEPDPNPNPNPTLTLTPTPTPTPSPTLTPTPNQVNEAVCEPSGDIYSGPLVLGVRQGDGVVRSGDAPVKGGG